jgi:predicted RNA polymerase sigma factor
MDAAGTLAEVLKGEGPRVLATLATTIGDLAVAEDRPGPVAQDGDP